MSADVIRSTGEMSTGRGSSGIPRERINQLAECLWAGCTRKETAEALRVSVRTVSRWSSDPAVLVEVERLRNRTDEELARDYLKRLLRSSENERIVLGAAQALLRAKNQGRAGESKLERALYPQSPEEEGEAWEEMALIEEGEQWHEAFSGAVYGGEVLTLSVDAFPEEIRGSIQDFLAAEPDGAKAQWTASKNFAPLTWQRDGRPYSPTGLVNKIRVEAGHEPVSPVAGVGDYWLLPHGVLVSDQQKFVSRYVQRSS
jgi:hypothetical protein